MNVEVILWGNKVGTLHYDEDTQASSFQYAKEFLDSGIEPSPILMPLSSATYSFNDRIDSNFGLPPMLRDSLPDTYGNSLINKYLLSIGRRENSMTPAERLCYEGKRGMGALEYRPDKSVNSVANEIEIDALSKLAEDVLNSRESFASNDLQELINVSTSAGGARAKAIVQYNEATGEFRSGQVDAVPGFEHYLIKLDYMNEVRYFTRIEYAYYLMAIDCGIEMNETKLLEINGKYHFLTKRFDRFIKNGKTEKLHMQTLASFLGLDYNTPNQIGYEDVARLMLKHGMKKDREQLYRRMVFNVCAMNNDDHVKNISFLMNKEGKWSLSPCYDMTFAYDPNSKWLHAHQMNINGKSNDITKQDLIQSAKAFAIGGDKASDIIESTVDVIRNFETYFNKALIPDDVTSSIGKELNNLLDSLDENL